MPTLPLSKIWKTVVEAMLTVENSCPVPIPAPQTESLEYGVVVPMPTLPSLNTFKTVVEALFTSSNNPLVLAPLPKTVSLEVGVLVPVSVLPMETRGPMPCRYPDPLEIPYTEIVELPLRKAVYPCGVPAAALESGRSAHETMPASVSKLRLLVCSEPIEVTPPVASYSKVLPIVKLLFKVVEAYGLAVCCVVLIVRIGIAVVEVASDQA